MRCIHCQNELKTGDVTCRHCGARVVTLGTQTSNALPWPMVLVALTAIAAIAVYYVVGIQPDAGAPAEPAAAAVVAAPPPAETRPEPPPPPPPPVTGAPATPTTAATGPRRAANQNPPPASATAPARRAEPASDPPVKREPRPAPPAPSVPVAEPAKKIAAAPVRVGGNIKTPVKTRDVRPVYPPVAISARVQGVVIIEATIAPDGSVQDARVLRSIPLLDDAALEAVRQWEFAPTFLNGVAVAVIMTVTVNFSLQ